MLSHCALPKLSRSSRGQDSEEGQLEEENMLKSGVFGYICPVSSSLRQSQLRCSSRCVCVIKSVSLIQRAACFFFLMLLGQLLVPLLTFSPDNV